MFCEINNIFTSFPVLPGVFVRIPPNENNLIDSLSHLVNEVNEVDWGWAFGATEVFFVRKMRVKMILISQNIWC